jgi:hypothetical protein
MKLTGFESNKINSDMGKGLFVLADILGTKWGGLSLFIYTPRGTQYTAIQASSNQAF